MILKQRTHFVSIRPGVTDLIIVERGLVDPEPDMTDTGPLSIRGQILRISSGEGQIGTIYMWKIMTDSWYNNVHRC
ncbi:hypothetical protein F441_08593 [Phytophthora nicotianae CJ01A1]|uniref:Uncharacterized protein n=5 Tax=Phytophthora nicotianae TaxID=4792 RepID=W2PC82_PHYN3|nr:hypothetical protein PPTG_24823 [Phytophthora nicotianae INRA-310]ETM97808.1 hypothetical protein PPTG_24823 [Phytophthora nicotianae INRA-310]ETP16890.1 hypothetical protein F441_08593 [Phytophthora nicotianae CJ01A1]ETP44944.1 hypothetical protein F442_08552 [Phytophthora nicotianae P10297]